VGRFEDVGGGGSDEVGVCVAPACDVSDGVVGGVESEEACYDVGD